MMDSGCQLPLVRGWDKSAIRSVHFKKYQCILFEIELNGCPGNNRIGKYPISGSQFRLSNTVWDFGYIKKFNTVSGSQVSGIFLICGVVPVFMGTQTC